MTDSHTPSNDLFSYGPAAGSRSPILLTHFDGAMDSGMAGRLAVVQMLRALPAQRLATFDSDQLIDYRAHRPIVTVDDWVTTGMDAPTIALDLLHDDTGAPLLLLHGPEPDLRWEGFAQAVADLAHEAGVELTVSLHGLPSGVPHTRPVQVHVHATDGSLVPDQAQMVTPLQFPSPLSIFLQTRLSSVGIDGVALLASVPYYMAENAFPSASSAMLKRLSEMAGLALPVGDLERGAADDITAITSLVESNPEIAQTVAALEKTFDALDLTSNVQDLSFDEAIAGVSSGDFDEASGADLSASVEAFLATIERFEKEEAQHVDGVMRMVSLLGDTPTHSTNAEHEKRAEHDAPVASDAPSEADTVVGHDDDDATRDIPIIQAEKEQADVRPQRRIPAEIEAVLKRIAEREERQQQGLPPLPSEPRHSSGDQPT